ncbi:MAG TPA: hypothetical protein VMV59_08265 [Candidatus Dormibacteraeota bacterium]|nr:hypothetical protein [Candidatus Dormibacteraeota bacterium]
MSDAQKTRERALEEAVSRAVRDNLPPLQRALEEMQQAFADLVSACSSTRPTNTLPAMLRAQSTAASLSASLSVLLSFVVNAMQRRDRELSGADDAEDARAVGVTVAQPEPAEAQPARAIPAAMGAPEKAAAHASSSAATQVEEVREEPRQKERRHEPAHAEKPAAEVAVPYHEQAAAEAAAPEIVAAPEAVAFDVAALPKDEQDLHKRANRVAKVSMQDIKMLRPEDVRKGCEQKDICVRLRSEIDKARKEYDRRFQKILEQPVDYFHHWMVEILAGGDPEALGEYPYPSPVLRR